MAGKTRRAGQIIKRGDRKYIVRIFVGRDAAGKRKYFSKMIYGSKRSAQEWLTAKLRDQDLGLFIDHASMSVNDYLDKWLEEVARIKVRPSTFEGYKAKLRVSVRNGIGLKRLCDLHSHDIQKLYNGMIQKGLSAITVRHVHRILSPAFNQAVIWKLIIQNPCDLCKLPRVVKREMKCFSHEETTIFLRHAKGDRYYAAFVLAIETGMRPEEYLGLKWKDIDFENAKLSINRALAILRGGGFMFDEPKTPRSRRSIPLSQSTLRILMKHRRDQRARMKLNQYKDNDLVFPTDIGTSTLVGNLNRRHFKKIIESAGLPKIRLYDLRHTTATLLLSKGINPKIVSERLGHSTISLTLDTYSHVLPTMQNEATVQIEKLLFDGENVI